MLLSVNWLGEKMAVHQPDSVSASGGRNEFTSSPNVGMSQTTIRKMTTM